MNLGDAHLRTVNTSRPQLLHSDSKRSIAASDDYYSLSDHASELSSVTEHATMMRYKTPPSQMHSPQTSRDLVRDQPTPVRSETPIANPTIRAIKFDDETSTGEPVVSESQRAWRSSRTEISPPTPGVDDMPYIQFAIEQLTRDEEVRESLGRPQDPLSSGEISPIEEDSEAVFHNADYTEQQEPVSPQEPERRFRGQAAFPYMPRSTENVLVPADPPRNNYRYPALDFIPSSLRLLPLTGLVTCCLLMIAALILSSVWASKHSGLRPYDGLGTSLYFVFEFLPQILGAIIVLWMLHIQAAAQRIYPFTLLASERRPQRTGPLHGIPLFLTNYLIPNLSSFRHRDPLLGLCALVFWLVLFTIPLLSCVYQTELSTSSSQGIWMWTTVQPVAWTLIGLYVLLIAALLFLGLRLRTRATGLKWDPVCLADIFVLVRCSNLAADFEGSEVRATTMPSRPTSLGYWQASNRPGDVFYGIGEDRTAAAQSSLEKGKRRQQAPDVIDIESQQAVSSATMESHHTDVHSPTVRYRWTPWFMRDTWWILWLVLAFVLMIAFLVVSFVHQAVSFGFLPLLPAPTTALGFSPANFLYGFVPSLLGMIMFLVWQPIDRYYRALEPFSRLSNPSGETAEQSLLLSYTAYPPVKVSVTAALAGHYKVAWTSFIGLLSISFPILGGGLFTAEFNVPAQDVREVATMPAYYALAVFVVIYAFSFLVMWPEQKRYLPHDIRTVGDLISFVYQSPMTNDIAFREPRTKTDLVTRLVSVPPGEREIPLYAFGVYVGRDKREHLGIDRLQRPGFGEMLVTAGRL